MAHSTKMIHVLQCSIKLLLQFLLTYLEHCGEIVEVRTNIARFEQYITKRCYPKGLGREDYKRSVEIQQLLERHADGDKLPPWVLKAFFIS